MSIRRIRQRSADTTTANTNNTHRSKSSWMDQGESGFSRSEQIKAQNSKFTTQRFWLSKGSEALIVLLDETPGVFIYEHAIWDDVKKKVFYETVQPEIEVDILEERAGKAATYTMYLTCIDTTPWTDKEGNERQYSKKLLPIKNTQIHKFKRLLEKHGTFRGMNLYMYRDADNHVCPKIGEPEFEMYDPDNGIKLMPEEEILANFGHEQIVRDGKVIKEENEDTRPFDYLKILKPSSHEELIKRYNLKAVPGSNAFNSSYSDSGDYNQEEDTVEDSSEGKTLNPRRRRVSRRSEESNQNNSPESDNDDIPPFDPDEDSY